MKKIILLVSVIGILIVGNFVIAQDKPKGGPFQAIWEAINNLAGRVATLENNVSDLNTQISQLDERIDQLENKECVPGDARACDTGLLGICSVGTRTCNQNWVWGQCVQNNQPTIEVRDGLDNDCNGEIDENLGTAEIEVLENIDNPKDRAVVVQSTAETTGVTLAKLNVKATNNAAILRTVKFKDATASSTLKTVYLYDGDTLLSSTSSIETTSSTLANVDLTIPKDTTKVLTLKGDIYKAQNNYVTAETGDVASSTITVEANADGFDAEDSTTYAPATVTGSTVTPGSIYFFQKAPSLALVSVSINRVAVATGTIIYYGKAEAKVKINVTASGGDIYVASSTTNALNATTTIGASTTVLQSIASNATETTGQENWIVYAGETKWFEIYAQLTRADDGNSSTVGDLATYVYLEFLEWASSDPGGAAVTYTQTWGLTDFKTGSVVLEYFR